MTRNNSARALLMVMILAGLAVVGFLAWRAYTGGIASGVSLPGSDDGPPQVFILQPGEGVQLTSGQGLTVAVYAFAPGGLGRIEFLVDGRVDQQFLPESLTQEGQAAFTWFSSSAGAHRLSAVAYDRQERAAEAAVPVTVLAAGALPEVSAADAQAVDAGAAEPGADEAQAGEAPSAEDGAPPQIPPQPQDAPPAVDRFEVSLDVAGNGLVTASLSGAASDDLGLQNLTVTWRSDLGQAGDTAVECGGELSCGIEAAVPLGAGKWVFSFQARDSSGQASPPAMDAVEVMLNGAGFPPAAAEHDDFNDWLNDWFVPGRGGPDLVPGFDLDGFMDDLFEDQAAGGEAVQADGQCLSLAVEPRADGDLVTLTVQCELKVEGQDRIVLPHVGKYLAHTGDGGISLFIPEWYDNRRTSLSPGDTFTWLDSDVTCGAAYRYSGRVDEGQVLDYERASFSSVGLGRNLAFASAEVTTPDCPAGSLGDVNLRAEAQPEGARVLWDLRAGAAWPADLPDEGVTFILTRFDPASGAASELYHQNVPADLVRAGGEFDALDANARCGDRYWYSLSAIAADADLSLVSPGWLLRAEVQSPERPCDAQGIGAIQLGLMPYWFDESNVRMRLEMQLPPGFAWPQGDNVVLEILRVKQGQERCEAGPCRGEWQVKKSIPITDAIRRDGLDYSDDDVSVSFGRYTYSYRLGLAVDGQEVSSGPSVSATMPPAPPPPPEIDRLTLSNTCPNGAPRCVIVEWQPYESPQPGGYYAPAARIAVERVVGAIDQRYFLVGRDDTRYFDLNPFLREVVLVDGRVQRICRHDVLYRMVAFDAEGHTYGASPLSVQTPDCDAAWDLIVQAR